MTRRLHPLATILASLVAIVAASAASAFAQPNRRLPPGSHWGRCLLIVRGETRISGPCSYRIERGGDFHIDGPRQVFDGIDYPKAEIMAEMRSADYWADVFRDEDGRWTGYGNGDIRSVHGEDYGDFGELHRVGACFVSVEARICLWRD